MPGVTDAVTGALGAARRVEALGRNVAEYVWFGGLRVDEESSPYEVSLETPTFRLRHYFPNTASQGLPALLLVPPLMMMTEVYDTAPRSSSVRAVHESGIDVWVVDFGRPESVPGGLERDVADHVVAVSDAVAAVVKETGRDVVLGGYSQGGMFCYQAAAYRRGDGIDSVIAFGSPVDFGAAPLPIPLSADSYASIARGLLRTGLVDQVSLPGWFNRSATRLLEPLKALQFEAAYLRQLHDRERLLPGEQQRKFLAHDGWTHYAGPSFKDLLENVLVTNRLRDGGLVVDDRTVSLADLDLPLLIVIGDIDREGHPRSVRSIMAAAPRAEIHQMVLHTGHFGIVAGGGARRWTWPRVAEWIRWRAGQAELPSVIEPARDATPTAGWSPGGLAQRVQSGADLGVDVVRSVYNAAAETGTSGYALARDLAAQLPLLNRIDALRPDTAISLGLLLDESARRSPEAPALLYGDRVLRRREVKHRIDSIVAGMLAVGVRPGERVGVLMDSRPSAFSVVAAISRIGASAVLLRAEGSELARELELGAVGIVVCDPEHVPSTPPGGQIRWCVLGGAVDERALPGFVTDLETIDPERVRPPAWYRPNPTRAADVALVLFTGHGARTRARVITNRRWALSALGTASAAEMGPTHTVYSATPLDHSSAQLMAIAGAVASGARLAFASAPDVETFWSEVRRYGATHVSYTWSSLRDIASGPEHPNERHHPVRIFMGSGMPPNLWRRVLERFAPTRVLEFYASAEGEAILANVADRVGSVGRPVPGTARVRIAALDERTRGVAFGRDGFARECEPGEPGLLLARDDSGAPGPGTQRAIFTPEDAWRSTGDVFVRGRTGEYWFVDAADALIPTASGLVAPARVAQVLQRISGIDTAEVVARDGAAVASVTLFPGAQLSGWELTSALRRLPAAQHPPTVSVVEPVSPPTPWSRPHLQGAPVTGPVWERRPDGTYEPTDGTENA